MIWAMRHILLNFPMPPTANKQTTIQRYNRRIIKSNLARAFDLEVKSYLTRNLATMREINNDLMQYISVGQMIRVDTYFCFGHTDLITKDNRPKIVDTNNRIKATLDAIANSIGIDDRYFSQGFAEKVIKWKSSDVNHCIVMLEPCQPIRSEKQVLEIASLLPRLS
jgi:hypothetical protein